MRAKEVQNIVTVEQAETSTITTKDGARRNVENLGLNRESRREREGGGKMRAETRSKVGAESRKHEREGEWQRNASGGRV